MRWATAPVADRIDVHGRFRKRQDDDVRPANPIRREMMLQRIFQDMPSQQITQHHPPSPARSAS